MQFSEPDTGAKKPGSQDLQVSGSAVTWKEPAAQASVVTHAEAPAKLMEPSGHGAHAALDLAPVTLENVFALQGEGAGAPAPQKNPAGHVAHAGAPLAL